MATVLNLSSGIVVCESLRAYINPGERRDIGSMTASEARMLYPELDSLESRGRIMLLEELTTAVEEVAVAVGVEPAAVVEPNMELVAEPVVEQVTIVEPVVEVAAMPKKSKKSSK